MKWGRLTVGVICLGALVSYLYFKQDDMVVTWLKPGADNISEKANWIYGKYSNGKIVHARECLEFATGWNALKSIWPLSFALFIVSFTSGLAGGYSLRDNHNAAEYNQKLSELEQKYQRQIDVADKNYRQAEQKDADSRRRIKAADQKEYNVTRREKSVSEKELNLEKIVGQKCQEIMKKLQSLQEDHNKRGHKMENLEKERIELKRKNNSLEKEILELQEKNLTLTKEKLTLKRDK